MSWIRGQNEQLEQSIGDHNQGSGGTGQIQGLSEPHANKYSIHFSISTRPMENSVGYWLSTNIARDLKKINHVNAPHTKYILFLQVSAVEKLLCVENHSGRVQHIPKDSQPMKEEELIESELIECTCS